ncbi:MAG: thioredoxin family protein [Syntrophales bacterium]
MSQSKDYVAKEPDRAEIDALEAPTVLEFSTGWCGHCQAAQPLIGEAFAEYPQLCHIKV